MGALPGSRRHRGRLHNSRLLAVRNDVSASEFEMPQTQTPVGLLNYEEAAALLGTDTNLVRRLVARRRLRAVKLGHRTVRFRKADLDAFIDRSTTRAIA